MAVLTGHLADIYIATGTGTAMTAEACSLVSGTTYQITLSGRRYIDPSTAITVYGNGVAIAAADYEIAYGSGKIIFDSAPATPVTITGAYLTMAQLGQAFEWSLDIGYSLRDTTQFGNTWRTSSPTIGDGSGSFAKFKGDAYFLTNINNYYMLALYEKQSTGARYMFAAKVATDGIKVNAGDLIGENVSFQTFGYPDYSAT